MYKRSLFSMVLLTASTVAHSESDLDELVSMSLEELSLLHVTVDTASKFSQDLADIPAAVYVLDGERIKRSGARSLADALNLVPGLRVSHYSAAEPIVSSRGFHSGLFNKMLVLQDGRSLYSPIYGGVYWADVDYPIEDIDRIEVLRGPAGSIWGGNAENGVINIVTKSATETLGGQVSFSYQKYGSYDLSVRQGLLLSPDIYARAYYKHKSEVYQPITPDTRWNMHSAGIVVERPHQWILRLGGEKSSVIQDMFTVDYANGFATGTSYSNETITSHSYYAQLDTRQTLSDNTESNYRFWLQQNYDSAYDAPGKYSTFDAEFNFSTQLTPRQQVIYGGGYRYIALDLMHQFSGYDLNSVDYYVRLYNIDSAADSIVNSYIQHEGQWTNKLKTVVGVKAEYFEQGDNLEFSPQLRAIYDIDFISSVWAGVGRGIVAPSYMDTNSIFIANQLYCPAGRDCSSDFRHLEYFYQLTLPSAERDLESVITYDIGYRLITENVELDASVFYSHYDNIDGVEYQGRYPGYDQIDIYQLTYSYVVDSYGVEIATRWMINDSLSLYGSYSYLTLDHDWQPSSTSNGSAEGSISIDSQHLASLQMLWQVTQQIQFDLLLNGQEVNYVSNAHLDNYLTLDVRLAWQANPSAPLVELLVQNLAENQGFYEDINSFYLREELVALRLSYEY